MEAGRPTRVLVVEDDEDIAQVLQRSLRLEGYEVRIAGDGEAALTTYPEFAPDLMVLDLGLPKLDGVDVARRLREGGLRVEVDERTESVGKKIREAEVLKVHYMLVVGDQEQEAGAVAVRRHREGDLGAEPVAEFARRARDDIAERR